MFGFVRSYFSYLKKFNELLDKRPIFVLLVIPASTILHFILAVVFPFLDNLFENYETIRALIFMFMWVMVMVTMPFFHKCAIEIYIIFCFTFYMIFEIFRRLYECVVKVMLYFRF